MAGGASTLAADRVRIQPAFLEGFGTGRRFGLWVEPATGVPLAGAILCVQPFGDEATLTRRVLTAQARRLALRGWTTLIFDPYGTGDSDGATEEATLAQWRADLIRAAELVKGRAPGRFVLWGTRMGTLLATEVAAGSPIDSEPGGARREVAGIVLWQPPASGAALIDPLLKLAQVSAVARAAGGAAERPLQASSPGMSASESVTRSRAGHCLMLAGYLLRQDLIDGLAALELHPPAVSSGSVPCPVLMLGMQRVLPPGGSAPKALVELARQWETSGHEVAVRAVQSEPFWSSLEPSTPMAAFEATEAFLRELSAP